MSQLPAALSGMFTPLSAVSFLIFTLLYTPCIAAISTVRGELKSSWEAVKLVIMQCAVAWLTAFLFYSIATVL
jgi:ferrous iron transport protein B